MAAPQDYFQRVDLKDSGGNGMLNRSGDNVREDFMDAIYSIAPVDTPFMSGIGRATSKDVYTSWLQDDLAEPNPANAAKDGDDIGADSSTRARRAGNINQISTKSLIISGRAETVDKAGRSSEMSYQLAKASKALKRDMEAILTRNQAAAQDTDGNTASKLGGLRACYRNKIAASAETTTALVGAGAGANGGVTPGSTYIPAAAVAGTLRALSETLMQTSIAACYSNGGNPDTIMVSPLVKTLISAYLFGASARVATMYTQIPQSNRSGSSAQATVDVYVSDFGTLKIIPSRYMAWDSTNHIPDNTTMHILDMGMWAVGYLRPFQTKEIAKIGDSERRLLLVDYTLIYKQEMASGCVADINSATPMIA
jgi:hypothetical protein